MKDTIDDFTLVVRYEEENIQIGKLFIFNSYHYIYVFRIHSAKIKTSIWVLFQRRQKIKARDHNTNPQVFKSTCCYLIRWSKLILWSEDFYQASHNWLWILWSEHQKQKHWANKSELKPIWNICDNSCRKLFPSTILEMWEI